MQNKKTTIKRSKTILIDFDQKNTAGRVKVWRIPK